MKSSFTKLLSAMCVVVAVNAHGDSTMQARTTETSGFLGDYSMLLEGGQDEALLRYVNPGADFSKYTKIRIEPIEIYAASGSALARLPREDAQALVNYLDASVREQLKDDYELTDDATENGMTLRIALTEAKGSKVVLDTVSSVVPFGIAASALKKLATGTPTGVGSARAEMELVDSVTKERLIAAVDERVGRKYGGDFKKLSKWQDAKDAYDYWAEQLKAKLAQLRAR